MMLTKILISESLQAHLPRRADNCRFCSVSGAEPLERLGRAKIDARENKKAAVPRQRPLQQRHANREREIFESGIWRILAPSLPRLSPLLPLPPNPLPEECVPVSSVLISPTVSTFSPFTSDKESYVGGGCGGGWKLWTKQ